MVNSEISLTQFLLKHKRENKRSSCSELLSKVGVFSQRDP